MSLLLYWAHANQYIKQESSLTQGDWIQLAIVGATLLAVTVALFQEKIRRFFTQAHLKVVIDLKTPHSHKIKQSIGTSLRGIVAYQDVIYVRIRVEHIKGSSARNAEVMLVNCWEYKDGEKILKKDFIPLNLTWANRQKKEANIKIPAGLFRYCDLGYLFCKGVKNNTRFHFDTIVEPNGVGDEGDLPNVIGAGKYEIELWVGGDNTKTIKKKWMLEFDGKWDESEEKMLSKHIRITEV